MCFILLVEGVFCGELCVIVLYMLLMSNDCVDIGGCILWVVVSCVVDYGVDWVIFVEIVWCVGVSCLIVYCCWLDIWLIMVFMLISYIVDVLWEVFFDGDDWEVLVK